MEPTFPMLYFFFFLKVYLTQMWRRPYNDKEKKERGLFMYYNYDSFYNGEPMMNTQLPEPTSCIGGTIYVVRPGDTMFRIANQFNISLQTLIQANPQISNPNVLFIGQRICIPGVPVPPPPPPTPFCPDGIVYVVQRGDSLFTIARRFGVTLERLIAANPQIADPNVLEIGQRICVPVPDVPLPAGICRVNLVPQISGVLGGTAFINLDDPTLWVTTFGLPNLGTVGECYKSYVAWVVDRDRDAYFRVELKSTGLPGIDAGYGTTTGSLRTYDEIIVTTEPSPIPNRPSGTVVLRGSLLGCR